MVARVLNSRIDEAEVGGSLSVCGQPELHSELHFKSTNQPTGWTVHEG